MALDVLTAVGGLVVGWFVGGLKFWPWRRQMAKGK